jgi:hypothetical protein
MVRTGLAMIESHEAVVAYVEHIIATAIKTAAGLLTPPAPPARKRRRRRRGKPSTAGKRSSRRKARA